MEKREFLTEKMTGFFGVRAYKEGTPMVNRKIKDEDETIEFNVFYASEPEKFRRFARKYKNKNNEDRWCVTFKIRTNARWFDEAARPIGKPNNADLNGKRWDVRIKGVELSGESARGYWVNAIQVSEHVDNPFTSFSGGVAMTPDNITAAEEVLPDEDKGGEDLPF